MTDVLKIEIDAPKALAPVRTQREQLAEKLHLALEQLSESDTQKLIVGGDLGMVSPAVQTAYCWYQCERLGLDPASHPFVYMTFNGKTVLYAKKECAEQLRVKHKISLDILKEELTPDALTIWVRATLPDGRHEDNLASMFIGTTKGEGLANLRMKCISKAYRRVTLAITGCGFSDEEDAPPRART